jgi:hypothetical protein
MRNKQNNLPSATDARGDTDEDDFILPPVEGRSRPVTKPQQKAGGLAALPSGEVPSNASMAR